MWGGYDEGIGPRSSFEYGLFVLPIVFDPDTHWDILECRRRNCK